MLDSFESIGPSRFVAMAKTNTDKRRVPTARTKQQEQAERLKTLRLAFGYNTATAFANFLGIGVTRYHPFEKEAMLTRDVAFLIVEKIPGMSLDWLFYGRPEALPVSLARRLGVFEKGTTD